MRLCLTFLILTAGGVLADGGAPVKTYGPPADRQWEPIAALTDEFDGKALDTDKWWDHNPGWTGRQPGWFNPANVTVADGELRLAAKAEDLPNLPKEYHTFTTAAVKSKTPVLYGYFEVRAQPMRSHASSAFWFYKSTPEEWTEIDVFEMGAGNPKEERTYHMTLHVFHTPTVKEHFQRHAEWKAPYKLADDFHVYALDWSKDTIKWLVDGEVVRSEPNTHWHQALDLNFDSETMGDWFGLPESAELPATFRIDYVRSWREKPAG